MEHIILLFVIIRNSEGATLQPALAVVVVVPSRQHASEHPRVSDRSSQRDGWVAKMSVLLAHSRANPSSRGALDTCRIT